MKSERLLSAVGQLPDDILLEAALALEKHHSGRRLRRAAVAVAAAAAVLLFTLFTAMALSEDFRLDVFRFLHISAAEEVLPVEEEPECDGRVEVIHRDTVGGAFEVEYIRIGGGFDIINGVICLYDTDETQTFYNGGRVTFYGVGDGGVSVLPAEHFETELSWSGGTYPIEFDWCVNDGELALFAYGTKSAGNDLYWGASPIPGRTDAVLLTMSAGRQDTYTEQLLLLDIETSAVTDPLEGCGVEELTGIINTEFSPDLRRALISTDKGETIWYCDADTHTLTPVRELAGRDVDGSWFIDNDTLLQYSMNEDYLWTYWTLSLRDGSTREILTDVPYLGSHDSTWGIYTCGQRYGLWIGEDGDTWVCDLLTGERTLVEGFIYPDYRSAHVIPNRAGDKLLFLTTENLPASLAVSSLGILDLESHGFTVLDRTGYEERREAAVSWFDDDRVFIRALVEEGENYLYLYSLTDGAA
ncbi:MAG: hypothetical protein ACI3VB_00300 [Oscillospiraceae bacterium]